MPQFCHQCGRQNSDKAKFCSSCGRQLFPAGGPVIDHRYRIEHEIKRGGMGCVYRAFDLRLNMVVALKKMLLTGGSPLEQQYSEERFREEGKLLSQLHHGGLPKVSDYFTSPDPDTGAPAHFIVMTFIPGKDLEALIAQRGGTLPFPLDEVVDIFRQLLHIIVYLHGQKPPVIYRDINPRNIMIHQGKVFLIDFGIARTFAPQKKATQIGTPGYAPIEQAKGYAEPRSDLYALAAVMHFLLTGVNPEDPARPPFHFEPPGNYNPGIPPAIEKLLMEMLSDRCSDRPPSAEKALGRLEKSPRRAATATQSMAAPGNYTTVFEAIMKNDRDGVKSFLARGIDYRAKNRSGNPPLHCAAAMGRKEIVALLLNNRAPVNLKNSSGETALHRAADANRRVIAGDLITYGAMVDEKNVNGWFPLHYASAKGYAKVVDLLIARGADVNAGQKESWRPLHLAAHKGSLETVMSLVTHGADLDLKEQEGWTAFHLACQEGHIDVVRFIGAHRALINTKEMDGATPLHSAVLKGHRRVVEYLIQEGAALDIKDHKGATPLDIAMQKGGQDIITLLRSALSGSAKSLAGVPQGGLPGAYTAQEHRFIASSKHYIDIFEAVHKNDRDAVIGFLLCGVKVNSKKQMRTPLANAAESGYVDMAELLIRKGAHVNDRLEKGDTLLHLVVKKGHRKMAELLLNRGAHVNAKNQEGKTPLQVAGTEAMKSLLRAHGAKRGFLWW